MLKSVAGLNGLARLLGFKPKALAYLLYKQHALLKYTAFGIPKRTGGKRTIHAPSPALKELQSRLSDLLQDCISDINKARNVEFAISHGFRRNHSIITNAACHRGKRFVLNVDLSDFFGSINFGRVRGYFISNIHFNLDPHVATLLAQICCHQNALPQGAPSSPVVSNLIGHILDIRLTALAAAHGCDYSRYADDLTFSTNRRNFPVLIAKMDKAKQWRAGKRLTADITRAGFVINAAKTRMQYAQSRQDVTGLVVNKKVNVRTEYVKTVRAMANSVFKTGSYWRTELEEDATGKVIESKVAGSLEELRGRMSFIENVKKSNWSADNLRPSTLMSYEKDYSDLLFYEKFYANCIPTMLFEGRTDNIYIRSAIERLYASYPELASKNGNKIDLKLSMLNYSETTARLLSLSGGTGEFNDFLARYADRYARYTAPPGKSPVVIFIDNDSGSRGIYGCLRNKYKHVITGNEPFTHVTANLYVVATPKTSSGGDTMIEDFFKPSVLAAKLGTKIFNPGKLFNSKTEYGKVLFAEKVVRPNRSTIDFSDFKPILDRIRDCIADYSTKA